MTNPIDTDPAEGEATGARVREFARIARETAEETTDPKAMAMHRARKAAPKDFSEARRAADTD